MCSSGGICAAVKHVCVVKKWGLSLFYTTQRHVFLILKHLAASQFQFLTEFHKVWILPITCWYCMHDGVNPHCPLWKVVTVFQGKRQRLAMQCTVQTCHILVFKMRIAFFECMICRPIVSHKFPGDSQLLPRSPFYDNALIDDENAF